MNNKIKERIKELNKKQKHRLKYAVLMSLVCIVLLSGATFAWFTISNSAKVRQMALSVASEGRLYIASSREKLADKSNETVFAGNINKVLYPCTSVDGATFRKPVYADNNSVTGSAVIDNEDLKYYCYETTLWIMVEEVLAEDMSVNDYDITLSKYNGSDGCHIVNEGTAHPEYCLRMSFETESGGVVVYEPNYDGKNTGVEGVDYAFNTLLGLGAGVPLHRQSLAGTFVSSTGTPYYEGDSSPLFTVTANVPTKVTVRMCFEGTDTDCMNSIQSSDLSGQLKFVSHKKGMSQ